MCGPNEPPPPPQWDDFNEPPQPLRLTRTHRGQRYNIIILPPGSSNLEGLFDPPRNGSTDAELIRIMMSGANEQSTLSVHAALPRTYHTINDRK